MRMHIFNVGHGACTHIETPNGRHVLIDAARNVETGWSPAGYLASRGITRLDKLIITNMDRDHVSGLPELLDRVRIDFLVRNGKITPRALRAMKAEGGMCLGVKALHDAMARTFTGPPPSLLYDADFGGVSFRFYQNVWGPPPFGFEDTNNLSLVTFASFGHHQIIFPGDIEKPGWRSLLKNPNFVRELAGVNVFVAPHHGRESGFCPEVMRACGSVDAVLISDSAIIHQSQEEAQRYYPYINGFVYDGRHRRILTTRRDGSMLFEFAPYGRGLVTLGVNVDPRLNRMLAALNV